MLRKLRLVLSAVLIVLSVNALVPAQTRIRFARGRTSASVSGTMYGGATRTYVLGAKSGQSLSANVSSRGDCVKFDGGSTSTSFVTESGDNSLYITNTCGRAASFTLTVSINYGG